MTLNLVHSFAGNRFYTHRWDFCAITTPDSWSQGWDWSAPKSIARIQKNCDEVAGRILAILVNWSEYKLENQHGLEQSSTVDVGPWLTESFELLNRGLLGRSLGRNTIRKAGELLESLGLIEIHRTPGKKESHRYRVIFREVNRAVKALDNCRTPHLGGNNPLTAAQVPQSAKLYPSPSPDDLVGSSMIPLDRQTVPLDHQMISLDHQMIPLDHINISTNISTNKSLKEREEADSFSQADEGSFAGESVPAEILGSPALDTGFPVNKNRDVGVRQGLRKGCDRPAPPPPTLKKSSTAPVASIHDDYRSRSLQAQLQRRGIEGLHNGGGINDWSEGAVNAVIAKMAEHRITWSKATAKEHLSKQARQSAFDQLELYHERMVEAEERAARSQEVATVIDHPAIQYHVKAGGEIPENLLPWQKAKLQLIADGYIE